MQLIRCTKKLQKEMGLKKKDVSENEPSESSLGSWHANLIYIDGKKCILFVNDGTLFNFIIPDIPRAQIRELSKIFKITLECVLSAEGIPDEAKSELISEYKSIQYANTNSQSILASMNDLAFRYRYKIQSKGGVHSYAVPNIIKELNHMPMGALEYTYPIEGLIAVCRKLT